MHTAPVPAWSMDFRDSEVARVDASGADLVVRFAVAAVHAAGHGGNHYLTGLELRLGGPGLRRVDAGSVGRLADGECRIDGRRQALLAVPAAFSGRIELHLQFANGARIEAEGRTLQLTHDGPAGAAALEHLHC